MRHLLAPFVLIAALPLAGAAPEPAWREALGRELDTYVSRLAGFGFSGALLVEKNGQVVLSKGYGWADADRKRPMTSSTAFEVASVAKQFTAAAVMKLAEQGRLALSDSLGRFFPQAPPDKRGIRLGQLLSHSAGIRGPEEANGAVVGDIGREEWLARVFATPLAFPPGTDNEYSNSGFSVAAAVVEVASGLRYEDFLQRELFDPAGMHETSIRGSPARAAQVASGFGDEGGGDPTQAPLPWGDRGAGGIITTSGDLLRWEHALRGKRVLSSASLDSLFAVRVRTRTFYDYGLAWRIQRSLWGTRLWWASGYDRWGNAAVWRLPDDDATVILLSNVAYDGFPLRDAIAIPSYRGSLEPILGGRDHVLPPHFLANLPAGAAALAGRYRFPGGGILSVRVEGSALRILPESQDAASVFLPALGDTSPARLDSLNGNARPLLAAIGRGGDRALRALARSLPTATSWLDTAFSAAPENAATLRRLAARGVSGDVVSMVTLPAPNGATTYAVLRARGAAVPVRLYWREGGLAAIQDGFPLGVLPPFRPQSAHEFVSYHIPLRKSLRVRFVDDQLYVARPDGELRAERVRGNDTGRP